MFTCPLSTPTIAANAPVALLRPQALVHVHAVDARVVSFTVFAVFASERLVDSLKAFGCFRGPSRLAGRPRCRGAPRSRRASGAR
eukprot:2720014-Lingulodinium_polyedra.AAC.1